MRVVVTGAPGWLGNRLLEVLTDGYRGDGAPCDWTLRCLVHPSADMSFLTDLSRKFRIEIVSGDITLPVALPDALRSADVVIHMAGIVHPKRIREFYEINTEGTRNLLKAAQDAGVRRFVYVSSNSSSGSNPRLGELMAEDVINPYLNYGISKYKAECLVREFQAAGLMETVILKPCWFYGPYQPLRQTSFFKMIKKGNPIIFGPGNNLRSLSYLDDICQAVILAVNTARASGQTYWIADERPYSCNEIYGTVAELLGVTNYKPRHVPDIVSEMCVIADRFIQATGLYIKEIHVAGEMNKSIACSIEKAKRELGYAPAIELREGMRRSIAWCRANGIDI